MNTDSVTDLGSLRAVLRKVLDAFPPPPAYRLALSGGRDSMLLLHGLHGLQLPAPLSAVHVHHGLHAEADGWAEFCARQCRILGIPLEIVRVDARVQAGESPEAWARYKRYEALRTMLAADEVLLTAHHEQDQAETLLLQLLRGAGPAGLAAMPLRAPFGNGWHLRPLLAVPAAVMADCAGAAALDWVEDHSNTDTRFDRNYLRQQVLPVLTGRWPQAARTLARAAHWQADAAELQADVARKDLVATCGSRPGLLSVSGLMTLSEAHQRNVLRAWVDGLELPLPSAAQLEQLRGMLTARRDASSCVRWPGAEVRRFRDDLYAMPPLPQHDACQVLPWNSLTRPLKLPAGTMSAMWVRGEGISRRALDQQPLTIRFRQGGERCRLKSGGPARTLKNLLQEWAIPPWLRPRIPLLYAGEELAGVADVLVCAPYQAQPDEEGLRPRWQLHGGRRPTDPGD